MTEAAPSPVGSVCFNIGLGGAKYRIKSMGTRFVAKVIHFDKLLETGIVFALNNEFDKLQFIYLNENFFIQCYDRVIK